MSRVDFKNERRPLAVLFLLALVYFLPALLKGNALVLSGEGTDTWSQFYFWRSFGFGMLARGELPLWNPYSFSGAPFIAGVQSAIFYPLNVLFLLFDAPFAINLSIALHCFLASLFTYLFARYLAVSRAGALLSGITFAYGAPYFLHIYAGHLPLLSGMWMPLMFLASEAFLRHKKMIYAVLGGVALSMEILAGNPQYSFYSAIAVSLYLSLRLIFDREYKRAPCYLAGLALMIATAISLSAIQLAPTLELGRHSVRNNLTYEWVSLFSLPPESLITLLLPDFFGDALTLPYWGKNYLWETSLYPGLAPLVLGAAAVLYDRSRPVKIFAAIAAAALVLAFGKYTPLLKVLYDYVPGFNLFRGLSKFIFVFSFAWAMLAGYGLARLAERAEADLPKFRRLAYGILAAAIFLTLLGGSVMLDFAHARELWTSLVHGYDRGADNYLGGSLINAFFPASFHAFLFILFKIAAVLAFLGGLCLIFVEFARFPIRLFIVAVLVLTAFDLWTFGARYLVGFKPERLSMDRELKAFLAGDKELFRIASPQSSLSNVGLLEGIENVGGYDQLTLKSYNEFVNFSQGLSIDKPTPAMAITRSSPLLDLLNARYYVLEPAMSLERPGFHLAFRNSRYKVYRNDAALPRSYIVHDAKVVEGRDAALRALAGPAFKPASQAVVAEAIDGLPGDPALQSPAPTIVAHAPNRVVIRAEAKAAGLLVLADVFYPGWKAFVDGGETPIYRVNYVVRGVFLPKGEHTVEFRYDPMSFKIGAAVTLASLMIVLVFLSRFLYGRAHPLSSPFE